MINKNVVLIALICCAMASATALHGHESDVGPFRVRSFSPDAYDGHSQTWTVAEDQQGLVYFTQESDSLLQFDGARWRKVDLPFYARSIAHGPDGRIYLGGAGEIGYLEYDADGKLEYHSLTARLPPNQRSLRRVQQILTPPRGVIFVASELLLEWRRGSLVVLADFGDRRLTRGFEVRGRLFFFGKDVGLFELIGDQLEPMPGADALAGDTVAGMIEGDDGSILAFTRFEGVFRYRGGNFERVESSSSDWLGEHQVRRVLRVDRNLIAVGTRLGGLAFLDQDLRLLWTIDQSRGLSDDKVHFIHRSTDGNLWIATNMGVSFVQFRPHLTRTDDGLEGSLYTVRRFADRLWVGSTKGCFFETIDPETGRRRFRPLDYLATSTWEFYELADELLIGTTDGTFVLPPITDQQRPPIPRRISSLTTKATMPIPGWPDHFLIVAPRDNQLLERHADGWRELGAVLGPNRGSAHILEASNGVLWMSDFYHSRLYAVRFTGSVDAGLEIRTFDGEEGQLLKIGGEIVLLDDSAALRYNGRWPDSEQLPFEEAPDLSRRLAGIVGSIARTYDLPDATFLATDYGVEVDLTHGGQPDHQFLEVSNTREAYADPLETGTYLVATKRGLYRYRPAAYRKRAELSPLIRRVVLEDGQGTEIFGTVQQWQGPERVAPAETPHVGFEFATPALSFHLGTGHQYRLHGFNADWSSWTDQTVRHYTNLKPGRYVFEVRARTGAGVIEQTATFPFAVAAPAPGVILED